MPPLVEDSEGSSGEGIPFRNANETQPDEDEQEEAGGSEAEDEYVVEKIIEHKFTKDGTLTFHVKWQGYDKPKDLTWETEDNLETAHDIVKEYYDDIGGRPEPPGGSSAGGKKRGRKPGTKLGAKRAFQEIDETTPESSAGRGRGRKKRSTSNGTDDVVDVPRKKKPAYPPASSEWDPHLVSCETIENPHSGPKGTMKVALLQWNDGTKSRHALRLAHDHAPKTMLAFYEAHLTFTNYDTGPQENTGDDDGIDDVISQEVRAGEEEDE